MPRAKGRTSPKPPMKGTLKALGELIVASMQTPEYDPIEPHVVKQAMDAGEQLLIVDCRDHATHLFGHIPGAVNVPYRDFMKNYDALPKNLPLVTVCYVGMYSKAAAQRLATSGYSRVASMKGGMEAWVEAGYPVTEAPDV